MTHEIREQMPERQPVATEGVKSAIEAIYNWNYEPEIEHLRTLYANGLERQWIAVRDLDWERGIDREAFTRTFNMGGLPISETEFWRGLPAETRWEVSRASAAFMLSNFLHGEQGALMVAGQLVSAVPHMDGKFYASTQTLDEARHVEVFAAYIRKLGEVHRDITGTQEPARQRPRRPDDWKIQGGRDAGRDRRPCAVLLPRHAQHDPASRCSRSSSPTCLRDEARHTGYGIKYLNYVVPTLSERENQRPSGFRLRVRRGHADGVPFRRAAMLDRVMQRIWSARRHRSSAEVMQKTRERSAM